MIQKLDKIFSDELKKACGVKGVEKLHGDASYRIYFRARLNDGSTYIVMQTPEGKSSASEEITNFAGTPDELPFINIANYLESCDINVPQIYRYSDSDKLMILEDLGDFLVAKELEGTERERWIDIYKKNIDLLVYIQNVTAKNRNASCIAFERSFDATLLNWEFDHFMEYCIEARQDTKVCDEDRAIFETQTRVISDAIESLDYGFTHRDFQSRNIIVRDDELYLIDFQDALEGPRVYDLVSLLRDSYVSLTDDETEELLAYYADKSNMALDDLKRQFYLVTIQRKLKDSGRFVYIEKVKGNPNYLRFIPTSLEYVSKALHGLGEYEPLLDLLAKYLPENFGQGMN